VERDQREGAKGSHPTLLCRPISHVWNAG